MHVFWPKVSLKSSSRSENVSIDRHAEVKTARTAFGLNLHLHRRCTGWTPPSLSPLILDSGAQRRGQQEGAGEQNTSHTPGDPKGVGGFCLRESHHSYRQPEAGLCALHVLVM